MITLEQLQAILASDAPTDMWLLFEDGHIEARPETADAPIDTYLDPNTWPRYVCRSEAVDNLVTAMGETRALNQVNMMLNTTVKPQSKGAKLGAAIAETLTQLKGAP